MNFVKTPKILHIIYKIVAILKFQVTNILFLFAFNFLLNLEKKTKTIH